MSEKSYNLWETAAKRRRLIFIAVVILPAAVGDQLSHLEEDLPGGTVERFKGHHDPDGSIGPQFLAYLVDMPSSSTT